MDERIPMVTMDHIHKQVAPTPPKDPLKLTEATIKAVDQIGENTAKEIEEVASTIRKEAEIVAGSLDDLGHAIRERTIEAGGHVAEFINRTTHALTIVRDLHAKLTAPIEEEKTK